MVSNFIKKVTSYKRQHKLRKQEKAQRRLIDFYERNLN